jgi:putative ABC transport system ATP-binding protein
MYEVRTVSKWFVKGPTIVRAVDAVSLEIEAGEFVALEGPSGSGKTTLLQLLGALDRPSEGAVDFEGRDLATLRDNELARLRLGAFGFVFQQFNLIPTPSAVQNVESALAPAGVHGVELRERSEALLAEVGLADEPTGNLDSATGDDVIDLLAGLAATHGATVVVATHDADRAARATKRLAMRDGKILSPVSAGA